MKCSKVALAKNEPPLEPYLEPSQTFVMDLFLENRERLKAINCFRKKTPSYMFDNILNNVWHVQLIEIFNMI